jgi:hypothetical protein
MRLFSTTHRIDVDEVAIFGLSGRMSIQVYRLAIGSSRIRALAGWSAASAAIVLLAFAGCSGGEGTAGSAGGGGNEIVGAGGSAGSGSTSSGGGGGAAVSSSSGNGSTSSGSGGSPNPVNPCDFPATNTVDVTDTNTLKDALDAALPGTKIRLADGTYEGQFSVAPGTNGTEANPIILCGSRQAILDQGGKNGYTFHLEADWWILSGFTIARGQKSVMLDGANHNLLTGLEIRDAAMEIIHFRCSSADNTLQDSDIHGSGKADDGAAGVAEGIYIGTNNGECADTKADDKSDRNRILRNNVYDIYSECIDAKEGTLNGEIRGNTFDGNLINGANSADSWVDIKGVGYVIADNIGKNSGGSGLLTAGFQTHFHTLDGSGSGNTFSGNTSDAKIDGFGIEITSKTSGNVVKCDNIFPGATSGHTNVMCTN